MIEFVAGVFLASFFGFLGGEAIVDYAVRAGVGPRRK